MTRAIIAGFLLLAVAAGAAHAFGLGGEGIRFGRLGAMPKKGTAGGGGTNFILLVDNTSRILQTDNTSKICLATGC